MGTTILKTRCFESKRIFAPFWADNTSSALRIREKPRAAVSLVRRSVDESSNNSWERMVDVLGARRRARALESQKRVFIRSGSIPVLTLWGKFWVKKVVA